MIKLDEKINKIKTLRKEIIAVNEHTLEGQKRLKEILVELSDLDKELLDQLQSVMKDGDNKCR